ncbi:hypothetical protein CDAR_449581 [Caerostris darwini]|uniref:Uncharacterized protein n=1 Tax=Caerostris darwini TaxID=1538125 RepID=A0AAV4QV77_9ARAC|nr:hypothetical protein CDAR_449581 [Caerostris darwini]
MLLQWKTIRIARGSKIKSQNVRGRSLRKSPLDVLKALYVEVPFFKKFEMQMKYLRSRASKLPSIPICSIPKHFLLSFAPLQIQHVATKLSVKLVVFFVCTFLFVRDVNSLCTFPPRLASNSLNHFLRERIFSSSCFRLMKRLIQSDSLHS